MEINEIVKKFKDQREVLAKKFLADVDADAYLSAHSKAADEAVLEILKLNGLSEAVAVVAVGGYGREQQFPFSDLDLLFLLPDDVKDKDLKTISEVIGNLWSLGLTVGYSVRKIEECLEQADIDITAQTAMLESRLISGNAELFKTYSDTIERSLNLKKFYRAKFIEQQQRHLKYHESSYALEPNIKEAPGGLRDLNILIWVLRAARLGNTWQEVFEKSLITRRECELLESVTKSLYRLRIHMHLLTNRHEDRLIFEIQEPLAKALGIVGTVGRRPSEVMMQHFYVNAKTIGQLNSIILQAIKERYSKEPEQTGEPICSGFVRQGDVLGLESPDVFVKNPERILEAFLIQERHPDIPMKSSRLYRALFEAHSLMNKEWAENPVNRQTFLKIIQGRRGVWHALEEMNRWGVLGKLLPSFNRIVGQMQHDLFHAYTVDQHTLLAIRYLRNFTHSENAHELPLCTELMMAMKGSWRLVLALLYHDIGKGRGGDHSKIGAEIVRQMCRDFE
ncbi:MAG TPA: [protein-PII] uridylyltransferase, partial [Sutterellaceae bacterium]|nr:[protein-PII] uridylyltransferase [Sutterellaceae bacterium]